MPAPPAVRAPQAPPEPPPSEPPRVAIAPKADIETRPEPSSPSNLHAAVPAPPADRLAGLRPRLPGGGLQDGRGGIEGEAVPLDTHDPDYSDYFGRVRRQIQEKWIYPREAGDRNIGGTLTMEFGIARDGHLRYIELDRSSGVTILDEYALNAVKLASPFPYFPESIRRRHPTGLRVGAQFNYIVDISALNKFLR
jgi:periplasmic protein TonB